jgi:hypothetical protein
MYLSSFIAFNLSLIGFLVIKVIFPALMFSSRICIVSFLYLDHLLICHVLCFV